VVEESGLSVFDLLRYRQHDHAAVLCAFDLIELNGNDLRLTPVEERKGFLAKLLTRPQEGIAFNQYFACDGAILYKHACALVSSLVTEPRFPPPWSVDESRSPA
jgi:bifunctional non-homologous end joining protein LigD